MQIVRIDFSEREYKAEAETKDLIVLHHTVSSTARSAIEHWKADKGESDVATAYIIDKDGTVYQLFMPEYWAIHIYRHQHGEDRKFYRAERRSIGIELVNEGPLTHRMIGNKSRYYWHAEQYPYNGEVKRLKYLYKNTSYYWAKYTEEQYISLGKLIQRLCSDFGIEKQIIEDEEYLPTYINHSGILSHRNLVSYKTDISPAFEFWKLKEYANIPY